MRNLFLLLAIPLFVVACSSTENNASPDELANFCLDGYRYTLAGEEYCIVEKLVGETIHGSVCPDGFTGHPYHLGEPIEDEQKSTDTPGDAAPVIEQVFICTKQAKAPDELTAVLNSLLNHRAPSQVDNCQAAGQNIYGYCGACGCTACDADEKTCTHMQCELSTCEDNQLCETRQCVPNPEAQGLTCDNILERWDKFSARYMDCETAADCTIFNVPSSCDYSMAFNHSGDVINREGARFTSAFFAVYQSDECAEVRELNKTYDAAPAGAILCRNNRCGYEMQYCNLPPDM